MKKISILFLTVIFCISLLLFSCGKESPTACSHEYSDFNDITCNLCSAERPRPLVPPSDEPSPCEHVWTTCDADLCEYLTVCSLCGTKTGENVEHIYIGENGDTLDACLTCGKENPSKDEEIVPTKSDIHVTINGTDAFFSFPYDGTEFNPEEYTPVPVPTDTVFLITIELDIPLSEDVDEKQLKDSYWGEISYVGQGSIELSGMNTEFEYDESTRKTIKIKIEHEKPLLEDQLMQILIPLQFSGGYKQCLMTGARGTLAEAEPSDVTTSRLPLTYVFGHKWSDDIPYASLLFDHSHLSGGFGEITVPEDVTAGDILKIVHTGYIETQETYPGNSFLVDGEVISYSIVYSEVIHLSGEDFSIEKVNSAYSYNKYNPYVILDRSGRYISLERYTGNELYLVVDSTKNQVDEKIPVACMLAYNPRDPQSGQPGTMYVPPIMTEEEAIELASEHFFNEFDYKLPPEGYVYTAKITEHWNTAYYHVLFSVEYVGGDEEAILDSHVSYTYRVTKALYEIEMIITNRN